MTAVAIALWGAGSDAGPDAGSNAGSSSDGSAHAEVDDRGLMRVAGWSDAAPHEIDAWHPGDRVFARIAGLVPGALYTVRLARRIRGEPHASFLETAADANGFIDTRTAQPVRGSYADPDPDGLFWSMRREAGPPAPGEPGGPDRHAGPHGLAGPHRQARQNGLARPHGPDRQTGQNGPDRQTGQAEPRGPDRQTGPHRPDRQAGSHGPDRQAGQNGPDRQAGQNGPRGDDALVWSVERDGAVLHTRALRTEALRPGVRARPLAGDHGLVGTLHLPASSAPRPAILVLGGSAGGVDAAARYAAALANHGFVALALAYFGAPGLPPGLVDIPLEYFERALRFLQGQPAVDPDRLAVVGRSRGGELALLLGARFAELRAVVAHVPSPYRWCGTAGPTSAAWTDRGAALPFLAPTGEPAVDLAGGRVVCSTTPQFLSALDGDPDRAMSAIEATAGPILLLSADDDQVWPSALLAERAMQRLARRTARQADAWVSYPAAGHDATRLPGDPTTETATYHPVGKIWLQQGGTPEGNARAQRDAWDRVVGFLRRHLS